MHSSKDHRTIRNHSNFFVCNPQSALYRLLEARWKKKYWLPGTLAGAFALLRAVRHLRFQGPVGPDGAVGDPGLVHAALHPLHDEVQQQVHGLVDVLAVRSAGLKVLDSVCDGKARLEDDSLA